MKIIIEADTLENADWIFNKWKSDHISWPPHCVYSNRSGFYASYNQTKYGYKLITWEKDADNANKT